MPEIIHIAKTILFLKATTFIILRLGISRARGVPVSQDVLGEIMAGHSIVKEAD